MKRIMIAFSLVFLLSGLANAQQDPLYNQYLFNQLVINPAYTGIHNMAQASLITRAQWIGLDGAPLTTTASLHTSFLSNRVGAGLLLINDRLGVNNNTEVHLTYGYKIYLGDVIVSFGLQSGLINYRYDYNELNLEFVNDPNFLPVNENFTRPNFGSGIFVASNEFYAGVSVPRILDIEVDDGVMSSTRYKEHYYITGGALITLDPYIQFKPSFLLKIVSDAPYSLDLSGSFYLGDILWVGLTLRNLNTVGANAQLELNDSFRLGYSFELPTSTLITSNFGTHEIMLAVDFAIFTSHIVKRRFY